MQYVVVYKMALEHEYAVGPFDSEKAAHDYARDHHALLQIWAVSELRPPKA